MNIREIRKMLTCGEASCRELIGSYLERIERENSELSAFITVCGESALKTADGIDALIREGKPLPPLAGVPVAVKDNISTRGVRTTCASRMLENYVPVYNASVVELLSESGAVIVGKANMDEFAMGSTGESSYFGAPVNPHNRNCVAGGSSGGVAAAVAGGLAAVGLGSDTGGSIRQPASFCGAVGLKPTYGAVSRYGLVAFASSLDQIGPIAGNVSDAAAVFDVISKKDSRDMTCTGSAGAVSDSLSSFDLRGRVIGIPAEFYKDVAPDVASALDNAKRTFERLGAVTVGISIPSVDCCLPVYYILACAEASSNLGRYDGIRYGFSTGEFDDIEELVTKTRSEGFGDEVKRRILLGTFVLCSGYFDAYYNRAQKLRRRIKREFAEAFASCDMLLTPTVPITAIERNSRLTPVELYQTDICTVTANIAGLPALSVPCGFDRENKPVGMQLIGKAYGEQTILGAAWRFEKETGRC